MASCGQRGGWTDRDGDVEESALRRAVGRGKALRRREEWWPGLEIRPSDREREWLGDDISVIRGLNCVCCRSEQRVMSKWCDGVMELPLMIVSTVTVLL